MAKVSSRPAEMEVTLVVRDLEVMTHFYGEALGLRHQRDFTPLNGGSLMRRYAIGDGAVFKLMKHDNPPEESNPPGGLGGGTGFRHLLIVIDDIEDAVRRCEEAGGTVVRPVQQYGDGGPTIAILYDPEGNSFELIARGS